MAKKPVSPEAIWDDSRCAELDLLRQLVNEAAVINNGGRCLERIAKCIEIAEKLNSNDYNTGRAGFLSWLTECAAKDRFGDAD